MFSVSSIDWMSPKIYRHLLRITGLPWRLSRWGVCLQCGRGMFNPWVGKMPWRRKWQPTPVFLPREFHGERSLVGYSPYGHEESDTTEWLTLSLLRIIRNFPKAIQAAKREIHHRNQCCPLPLPQSQSLQVPPTQRWIPDSFLHPFSLNLALDQYIQVLTLPN